MINVNLNMKNTMLSPIGATRSQRKSSLLELPGKTHVRNMTPHSMSAASTNFSAAMSNYNTTRTIGALNDESELESTSMGNYCDSELNMSASPRFMNESALKSEGSNLPDRSYWRQ